MSGLVMDGSAGGCIVIPGPSGLRQGNPGLIEHVHIVGHSVAVGAVGKSQLSSVEVLGDQKVSFSDLGHIHYSGLDELIQRIDLVHVHGEVASQLEDVPHLIGSHQGFQLGKIVVEGKELILNVNVGMVLLVHLDHLHRNVMPLLGTPPGHPQGDGLLRRCIVRIGVHGGHTGQHAHSHQNCHYLFSHLLLLSWGCCPVSLYGAIVLFQLSQYYKNNMSFGLKVQIICHFEKIPPTFPLSYLQSNGIMYNTHEKAQHSLGTFHRAKRVFPPR